MQFSFTLVFSGLFLAYVFHSLWSIISIFIPPKCTDKYCFKSFLEDSPKLRLLLFSSQKYSIESHKDLELVDEWSPFQYNELFISKNVTIPLPEKTKKNGTLYIFAFIVPMSKSRNEKWVDSISGKNVIWTSYPLTQYLVPEAETFNLLNQKISSEEEEKKKEKLKALKKKNKGRPIVHIAKRLKLTMLTDLHRLPKKELPEDFFHLFKFLTSETYLPPFRVDRFACRLRDFYQINSTQTSLEMELEFAPSSLGLLRMNMQFEAAMETMKGFGFSPKDLDEIKGIFSDTNIYFLSLTMFVASIHLLFDFLAFKNDVTYWRHKKSVVGLSTKTILWRCFSQIVIFLYLCEEKSSPLIVYPSAVAMIIEIWKVKKAFKISFKNLRIQFGERNDSEKLTAIHDAESMKYLSYLLYPIVILGAAYSLIYSPHKSWYSWTITSLTQGVYAFGFLMMAPQLFVNYKLKSVAHLPWRAFMYKAFNTFIDDLFAFIIVMPTMHRMACFRDDIIFIIYLYQRWLYPVDKSRIDGGAAFEEFESDTTITRRSNSSNENQVKKDEDDGENKNTSLKGSTATTTVEEKKTQ